MIGGVVIVLAAGGYWFMMRSRELAAASAERALMLARRSMEAGNLPLAQSDLQKVYSKYGSTAAGVQAAMLLAQIDYDQGKYQEAARLLADQVEARWRKGLYPAGLPVFYTMSGQPDKLLEFWEWTVEQRDTGTPEGVRHGARVFPQLETNPRYQALLRRMGLP